MEEGTLNNKLLFFPLGLFCLQFFFFFFCFYFNFFLSLLQIDLKHKDQINKTSNKVEVGIDLREFYPSVEWDILGVPAERHEKYYPCCQEPYPGN